MLPLLPLRSQRSGYSKPLLGVGLSVVARVATTFNNFNKKKRFKKNFFISCGNPGNYGNLVYMCHPKIETQA